MAGFIAKGGADLTWGDQRAEMNGIRKGHPCGAAMYTSLTCLGHAEISQGEKGYKHIINAS